MADEAATLDVLNASAQGQLRAIIERIERLEEDKAAIANDLKEVFAEAKGNGFDTKILRKVIRIRKQDRAKRQEEEALTYLYLSAIGDLPLFAHRSAEKPSAGGLANTRITLELPGREPIHADGEALHRACQSIRKGLDDINAAGADRLYEQAVAVVRAANKASTSYVQRSLQLGYNAAATLMERMEREGVVGPANHAGKREVLPFIGQSLLAEA